MKKIVAIALIYAVFAPPVFAADDYYTAQEQDARVDAMREKIRTKADQLSTFSLLELNDNFSVYGKLSIPRLAVHDDGMNQRNAVTYGLHGKLGSIPGLGIPKVGIRFGWNPHFAGQNTGGNLYSLTAEVKF